MCAEMRSVLRKVYPQNSLRAPPPCPDTADHSFRRRYWPRAYRSSGRGSEKQQQIWWRRSCGLRSVPQRASGGRTAPAHTETVHCNTMSKDDDDGPLLRILTTRQLTGASIQNAPQGRLIEAVLDSPGNYQ